MSEEQLKKNLEAIFRYARVQSVNHNDSEDELIAIIQCREEVFKRLFNDAKEKDLTKEIKEKRKD
tara:strand:- start:437 stop:631 length:195 start_codon:yes stop_codon:yes gene_type:complete